MIWGIISGQSVEEKVEQYSEVYGEVLLGVHKELEKLKSLAEQQEKHFDSRIDDLHATTTEITQNVEEQVTSIQKQIKSQNKSIARLRLLNRCRFLLFSYVVATIGLGVFILMIWGILWILG